MAKIHKPKIDLFNPNKIINQDALNKAIDDGKLDFLLDNQETTTKTEKETE